MLAVRCRRNSVCVRTRLLCHRFKALRPLTCESRHMIAKSWPRPKDLWRKVRLLSGRCHERWPPLYFRCELTPFLASPPICGFLSQEPTGLTSVVWCNFNGLSLLAFYSFSLRLPLHNSRPAHTIECLSIWSNICVQTRTTNIYITTFF